MIEFGYFNAYIFYYLSKVFGCFNYI